MEKHREAAQPNTPCLRGTAGMFFRTSSAQALCVGGSGKPVLTKEATSAAPPLLRSRGPGQDRALLTLLPGHGDGKAPGAVGYLTKNCPARPLPRGQGPTRGCERRGSMRSFISSRCWVKWLKACIKGKLVKGREKNRRSRAVTQDLFPLVYQLNKGCQIMRFKLFNYFFIERYSRWLMAQPLLYWSYCYKVLHNILLSMSCRDRNGKCKMGLTALKIVLKLLIQGRCQNSLWVQNVLNYLLVPIFSSTQAHPFLYRPTQGPKIVHVIQSREDLLFFFKKHCPAMKN